MNIKVTSRNPRPTTTNAPDGVDLDASIRLQPDSAEERTITGEVTLAPRESDGLLVANVYAAEGWVRSDLLLQIRELGRATQFIVLQQMIATGAGHDAGHRGGERHLTPSDPSQPAPDPI